MQDDVFHCLGKLEMSWQKILKRLIFQSQNTQRKLLQYFLITCTQMVNEKLLLVSTRSILDLYSFSTYEVFWTPTK